MPRLRSIGSIIRSSGLAGATIAFFIIFIACSVAVNLCEPGISNIGDSIWLCFEAITTIGFGDIAVVTTTGRVVVVALSVISIFYIAVITGTVVSYSQERIRYRANASLTAFADQLEHLSELSSDELAALSEKVRRFRKVQRL